MERILVINPGATSTKIAVFDGERPVFEETIEHSAAQLSGFESVAAQFEYRLGLVLAALEAASIPLAGIDAVAGRGGLLRPMAGGTYAIDEEMLADLRAAARGEHASNLGPLLAQAIAATQGLPAFTVDPVAVDELEGVARVSGLPELPRVSLSHALNSKAVARKAAREMGKAYGEVNLVKKTSFDTRIPPLKLGEYEIAFMSDQAYADGVPFFLGEFANNCESLGKSGGDLCLFDAMSKSSRTFLIRKNGKIIGQSPLLIDDTNKTIVIASMISLPDADANIIRCLTEELAIELLKINKGLENVTIGIGGANFLTIGGKCFTRDKNGKATKYFEALGRIRHTADISQLAAERLLCEQGIGLPILSGFETIKNREVDHFMRDRTGAKKDFFRVAVLVSTETLEAKIHAIDAIRKKMMEKLAKPKGANSAKKHEQEEIQRRKNIREFTWTLPRVFEMVQGQASIICERKGLDFSISGVPSNEQANLCSELNTLSGGAIKASTKDGKIIFKLPKGFFGQNPTRGNEDKFWKTFCDKVEARWPRLPQQTLPSRL